MLFRKNVYLQMALILSALFWFSESLIHAVFFDEGFTLLPHHADDLWMRILIIGLLLFFGWFAQTRHKHETRLENEKREIYLSMIKANNMILNEFMQKMYLFKLTAEESEDFDKEILGLYNKTIEETKAALRNLEGLERPSAEQIEQRITP